MTKVAGWQSKIRSWLDPSRWMIRFLKLEQTEPPAAGKGLILIQIDGLSHALLQKAFTQGKMPFLKKLMHEESYQLGRHYPGIPSSTPSIQGELFYGVRQAFPAFKYRDGCSGKIFTFYSGDAARETEARLGRRGRALLKGGSSYNNIFTGGAGNNAHFCAASVGWKQFLKALDFRALAILFLLNLRGAARLFYLLTIELIVALADALNGIRQGYGARDECKFILSRLLVTIALRELAVLGCVLDISRALPVIHINFFGYDDHAHRRGPATGFAVKTLSGIDQAVRRVWNAAHQSLLRDYEVWVYSDHGQETVHPYRIENKRSVEEAVQEIYADFQRGGVTSQSSELNAKSPRDRVSSAPVVTAQGPLGLIYLPRDLSDEDKFALARNLVKKARIPLVLTAAHEAVFAFTQEGRFRLPEESDRLLGSHHPYHQTVGRELAELCRHPDAGSFVISGWRKSARSLSFPAEYGSHGGPGICETDGFVLLPSHRPVCTRTRFYLRPEDLRRAALGYLESRAGVPFMRKRSQESRSRLRVMSYNVHGCVGMDGKLSPERIARVIARHDPDVIALQELDAGCLRSRGIDQAGRIAEILDMDFHFHPVRMVEDEMFGNAVLSRHPLEILRAGGLPRFAEHRLFEPRGVLWTAVRVKSERVHFMTTHLSLWAFERKLQGLALCGPAWLEDPMCEGHIILCGDFNASPGSSVYQGLRRRLEDAQLKVEKHVPLRTWFSPFPLGRIDHIFLSASLGVRRVDVPASSLERMASDHLPILADIELSQVPQTSRTAETLMSKKNG